VRLALTFCTLRSGEFGDGPGKPVSRGDSSPAGRQRRQDCFALFLVFHLLDQANNEVLLRQIVSNQQGSKDDQQGDELDQVHIATSFRSPARGERASSAGVENERRLSQWTPVGVNRLPVNVPSTGLVAGGKWLSGSCTRKAAYPPADNEKPVGNNAYASPTGVVAG